MSLTNLFLDMDDKIPTRTGKWDKFALILLFLVYLRTDVKKTLFMTITAQRPCVLHVYTFSVTLIQFTYLYLGDGAGCFLCLHRRCHLWSNNTSRRAATKKAVSSWLVLHRVLRSRGLLLPGVSLQNAGNALWTA